MFKKPKCELSASIEQDFYPDIITQEGFSGEVTSMAYDPVQMLYAVGTDLGVVHVMGAGEIRAILNSNQEKKVASSPIVMMRFVTSVYLVTIDNRSLIVVWALDTRTEWARYQDPMGVSTCWTDPVMDWLFLGHYNGETTAFDIDRGLPTPFKINNLERLVNPKFSNGSVLSLSLHPRDPGTILIVYRDLAVAWNIMKGEILFDLHYEFPLVAACWHPSGSHIVTLHVNGFLVFWDGTKGVKLGARTAFPAEMENMDLDSSRVADNVVWCCKEDPTDTYIIVWGRRHLRLIEFGPTPIVATSSYEAMGNFYKNPDLQEREVKLGADIMLAQLLPSIGQPHFQGCYNPSHIVLLVGHNNVGSQFITMALPSLYILQFDAAVLPSAMLWRSSPITTMSTANITRNQWIGMMAASQPNIRVTGGSSASQQMRKLQLATVLCVGYANGNVKLFDATRADSRDYRVIGMSTVKLDPRKPVERIARVSVGSEVGEMAVATESGNVYLSMFGKNRRLTKPGSPAPTPDFINVEHLVGPELTQGYIPQWLFPNDVPTTALCNSNIGFTAVGYQNGRVVVIDKRGPALIMDTVIKGQATCIEFGIIAIGEEPYSSIVVSVGTTRGDILVYRVIPRQMGGYEVNTHPKQVIVLQVGKDPVRQVAHIDAKEGRSANAVPDMMARLASGYRVQAAILSSTYQDAKYFAMTGPKVGKKLGSKSFDTPLANSSYAYLRWGTSSALATVNAKGKVGIYGLPGLSTLCTYSLPVAPNGLALTISEMGDAFIPYGPEIHSGQIVRIFGTGNVPKDDDVYQLKRRVPARPTISTVHWMAGRQFCKPSDLDVVIGGKRRGKSKRGNNRSQLIDETTQEPQIQNNKLGGGSANPSSVSSRIGKVVPFTHPTWPQRVAPKKTWGQMFNQCYETAEDTVNEALDEAMGQVNSGKSSAQSGAIKGIIGSKLGF